LVGDVDDQIVALGVRRNGTNDVLIETARRIAGERPDATRRADPVA